MSRKCETTEYNTAELIQARKIMAAPMCRGIAREKVVNTEYPIQPASTSSLEQCSLGPVLASIQ